MLDFAAASGALGLLEVTGLDLPEVAGLFEVTGLVRALEGVFGAACLGVVTLTGLLAILFPFRCAHSQTLVSDEQWFLHDKCGWEHITPSRIENLALAHPLTGGL